MQIKVAVLLCTYNGAKYITEQLDTIFNQFDVEPVVFLSDDGSTDGTVDVVNEYILKNPTIQIEILVGPKRGFAANFMHLITSVPTTFEYYAFCDQDDIWLENKLKNSIKSIRNYKNRPSMYGSRSILINECGCQYGLSNELTVGPSFSNALVQSIAGGNTILFNKKLCIILKKIPQNTVFAHDWLAYILTTGMGGFVYYDAVPSIKYRQHGINLIGSNKTFLGKITRFKKLFGGDFSMWVSMNISALFSVYHFLTAENKDILHKFIKLRSSSFFIRNYYFFRLHIHRQTKLETFLLWVAIAFGKF